MSERLVADWMYLFYFSKELDWFMLFMIVGFALDLVCLIPKLVIWLGMWIKLQFVEDQELQAYYDSHAMVSAPYW